MTTQHLFPNSVWDILVCEPEVRLQYIPKREYTIGISLILKRVGEWKNGKCKMSSKGGSANGRQIEKLKDILER